MKKIDYKLLIVSIIMVIFGLVMIYSASSIWAEYKFHDAFHYLKSQGLFFLLGLGLMYIVIKIDYRLYKKQ